MLAYSKRLNNDFRASRTASKAANDGQNEDYYDMQRNWIRQLPDQ